jgi:uncharacterized NAD-dependent epimerase/dehydratase family protein
MLSFVKPSKVIAISVNTYHMSDSRAIAYLEDVQKKTGLPATDPIRFGAEKLSDTLVSYFKSYKKPKIK